MISLYNSGIRRAVRHLNKYYILPELHPAFVAQWILESNRGKSLLSETHNNFAGMKWRDELKGLANPLPVKVPSEDREVEFAAFPMPETFVKGFYRFLDRAPYKGWRECKTPEEYIEHIGKKWATDPAYIEKVKRLLPEARQLIELVSSPPQAPSEEAPNPPSEAKPKEELKLSKPTPITWLELFKNQSGGAYLVGHAGPNPQWRCLIRRTDDLAKLAQAVGDHNLEIAVDKEQPSVPLFPLFQIIAAYQKQDEPVPSTTSDLLKGLKVFLEAGHGWSGSGFDPGAVGRVQEWKQNRVIASACAAELRKNGAEVRLELYDKGTPARDLRTRGRIAGGSDVFISFHHNAFNGKVQGTETLYDRLADKDDIALAKIVQEKMAAVSPFEDRGVKQQGLGVLRGAKPGSFAACLVEAYFVDGPEIHDPDSIDTKLGIAVAAAIAEFAKKAGKI